ncbi:hypothetical protein RND71_010613 [Anisodus tanguticus]|uniref:Uncharacterized protein n=1 Tax=Anisodus tanguticus TaxID=243964 RepID=A0AAE1VIA5_9SOLA|nr:hypothetical protein RND71_010613 [Anisodus tanguticus]
MAKFQFSVALKLGSSSRRFAARSSYEQRNSLIEALRSGKFGNLHYIFLAWKRRERIVSETPKLQKLRYIFADSWGWGKNDSQFPVLDSLSQLEDPQNNEGLLRDVKIHAKPISQGN